MKNSIAVICSMLLLTSCVSTKKYGKYVSGNFSQADTATSKPGIAISVRYDTLTHFPADVQVKKGDYFCIPAVVFWDVVQEFNVQLNPRLPGDIFKAGCTKYADSFHLDEKIKGARLELTIVSLPTQFKYFQSAVDILFVYASKQYVRPAINDLVVSYRLLDGSTVKKQGVITLADKSQLLNNPWASTKKITKLYLNQYKYNIQQLSRQCMERVANELPEN